MLSEQMQKYLCDQIQAELHSGYLYLGLAYDFRKLGLDGFCHWLKLQWREENAHACKIIDYISDHGGDVVLKEIQPTAVPWECACEAFKAALDHERKISERVRDLLKYARSEGDFNTENLMLWFIGEQQEEEAKFGRLVKKLDLIGADNADGLIWIDGKLGERENPCGKGGGS